MMRWLRMSLLAMCWVGVLVGLAEREQGQAQGSTVEITSGGKTYPAYFVAPAGGGRRPAVILIHSINGFEPGYRTISDLLMAEGFAVLALQWQAYERTPPDAVMEQLLRDSIAYLRGRAEVDPEKIGLTGFCIGGRYTMLFLPLIEDFKAGVAWYGFPYSEGSPTQPRKPADLIAQLRAPMLIIHGTADRPSPIAEIYRYATELDAAGKYFELKVYQGQPHGFMLRGGQLLQTPLTQDAFQEMVSFFKRMLR
ncbi:MAG: dienelactone hydrolase family protein [Candidatus Bipolaricaulota bacterium]|nr:dienelactone hydrolase family protein [Candidatus Bipolaricaulota bacterium]MDW8031644.1 dienelactone hydrolase family protein [Candidatus Bipolaricaulota bacterium]